MQFFYSEYGKTYKPLIRVKWEKEQKERQQIIKAFSQELDGIKARYVKVFAKATEVCPDWHSASGENHGCLLMKL